MYDISELNSKPLEDLKEIAEKLSIDNHKKLKKKESLVYAILDQQAALAPENSNAEKLERPVKTSPKPKKPVSKPLPKVEATQLEETTTAVKNNTAIKTETEQVAKPNPVKQAANNQSKRRRIENGSAASNGSTGKGNPSPFQNSKPNPPIKFDDDLNVDSKFFTKEELATITGADTPMTAQKAKDTTVAVETAASIQPNPVQDKNAEKSTETQTETVANTDNPSNQNQRPNNRNNNRDKNQKQRPNREPNPAQVNNTNNNIAAEKPINTTPEVDKDTQQDRQAQQERQAQHKQQQAEKKIRELYDFDNVVTHEGVLDITQESYGFLRSSDYN